MGLRNCKGLRMARTRNNIKRQDCGHNWWSICILTLFSEVWTRKRDTCLCHQVKDASHIVIECQLSEKLKSQGDGSRQPNNIQEIPQLGIRIQKFRKWIPGTPALPKTRQKCSAEFLNAARNSSTSENAIFISFGIPFPKLRNPSWNESLKVTDSGVMKHGNSCPHQIFTLSALLQSMTRFRKNPEPREKHSQQKLQGFTQEQV